MGIFDFFRSKKEEVKQDASAGSVASTGVTSSGEPKADADASQPEGSAAADSGAPAAGDAGGGGGGDGGGV